MIKSQDQNSVWSRRASCFAENDTTCGIVFEKRNGTKRFVPHSFLSRVDFDGVSELDFRYASCAITVTGEALEPVWDALCRGSLARISEQAREPPGKSAGAATSIYAIRIEDDESAFDGPLFPETAK